MHRTKLKPPGPSSLAAAGAQAAPAAHPSLSPACRRAFILAAALTLAGGAAYRAVAARYANISCSAPLPPGTLAGVPRQMGDWSGTDVAMDERIIKATDTHDHLNRRYRRASGESVAVWVAYGVKLRDLMPHRPEVCYTGAGWTLREERRIEVAAADGSVLPCRAMRFGKSGLGEEELLVLNYYLVGDVYSPDVSSLRSQARRLQPQSDYMVQVQIVQSRASGADLAGQPMCAFAAQAGPVIRRVLNAAMAKKS